MKKSFVKIICAVLALSLAVLMTACNGNEKKSSDAAETTAAATADSATEATTTASTFTNEADLTKLHGLTKPGDLFTGYWKITDGVGKNLEHFVYCFDGNNNSYLLIGTMGYFAIYNVQKKDGKDVFSTQMLFGLNGDYTYEFAKDKNSVVLTNISTKSTTTLKKIESYTSIPEAPENPVVDEKLLGAWVDENGAYLYFDKSGIMYDCQKNITFTFYAYSAKDGKITASYSMLNDQEETAKYSFKDDKLVYNDIEYTRISANELV